MDFKSILNKYAYSTELHAHTFPVSACAGLSASEVVNIYKETGVNSLVITNHLNPHWTDGTPSQKAEEYLSDYRLAKDAGGKDVNVILGVEIRFPENCNDYLVYGVCEDDLEHFISLIPYGIENFYKEVKNDKNVIIQAHPFREYMVLAPAHAIDGIETLNLCTFRNGKPSTSFQCAKENNFIVSGSSDFHHKGQQALCLMKTQSEMKDSYDVANALKSKDVVFDCSGHVVIPYIY